MTTYFDDASNELREVLADVRAGSVVAWGAFGKVEQRVVFDCTVAAMQPTFPADLRELTHRIVLKYGITMLPVNAPPADFETDDEHYRRLSDMLWDLHSLYHELAGRGIDGFNDSPMMPMRAMYSRGDEEREQLVVRAAAAAAAKEP